MNTSPYALKHLTDEQLLQGLVRAHQRGNEITAELLAHLIEVEDRRLHLVDSYSSLFDYCHRKFGATEDEAWRRIQAARAARRFPRILELLARGELHLSTINLLAPHLSGEGEIDADELIEQARGNSKRAVEAMLAGRFPKPDAPTTLRRLPTSKGEASCRATQVAPSLPLPLTGAASAAATASATATKAASSNPTSLPLPAAAAAPAVEGAPAARSMAETAPAPTLTAPPIAVSTTVAAATAEVKRAVLVPLSAERFKLQLTLGREAHDLLLRAQELLRHQVPSGDLAAVLERALRLLCDDVLAKKFCKLKAKKPHKRAIAEDSAATDLNQAAAAAELSVPGRTLQQAGERQDTDAGAGESQAAATLGPTKPADTVTPSPKAKRSCKPGRSRTRNIPRPVRREVGLRDNYQCAYVGPSGERCKATAGLEFHHVVPYARGGEPTAAGIALRCRAHNRYAAELDFGKDHVAAAVRARQSSRRRGAVPRAAPKKP